MSLELLNANPTLSTCYLSYLLASAYNGKLVVPANRKDTEITVEQVKKTLVSILNNRFIGPFMILETDGQELNFKTKHIIDAFVNQASSNLAIENKAETILLTGRQKLVELLYACCCPDTTISKKAIYPTRFFVNTNKAIASGGLWSENCIETAFEYDGRLYFQEKSVLGNTECSKETLSRSGLIPFLHLSSREHLYAWLHNNPYPEVDRFDSQAAESNRRFQSSQWKNGLFESWIHYTVVVFNFCASKNPSFLAVQHKTNKQQL